MTALVRGGPCGVRPPDIRRNRRRPRAGSRGPARRGDRGRPRARGRGAHRRRPGQPGHRRQGTAGHARSRRCPCARLRRREPLRRRCRHLRPAQRASPRLFDAGSAGADTFEGLRRYVIEVSETRIKACLNISSTGMISPVVGELEDHAAHRPEEGHRGLRAPPRRDRRRQGPPQREPCGEQRLAGAAPRPRGGGCRGAADHDPPQRASLHAGRHPPRDEGRRLADSLLSRPG